MLKRFLLPLLLSSAVNIYAQQVQALKPARLGIFKNGTCFVKREGTVTVAGKSFFINAPEKALTGTYWVTVGKETSIHSVIVSVDTFKVQRPALSLADYLEANTGETISLYGNTVFDTSLRRLSGKLIGYNRLSGLVTVASGGKTVVTNASLFNWFETGGTPKSTVNADSLIPAARIKVNNDVSTISASTISLETGIKWYPSYLLTVLADKEIKLEMKATIVNDGEEYLGMPVDIIIGSPEMFFGTQIDPACITYLRQSLLDNRYDNNGLYNLYSLGNFNSNTSSVFQSTAPSATRLINTSAANESIDDKDGQKNGDLYYYHLGTLDLEKNSKVIVPVMNAAVTYDDVYSADVPAASISLRGENAVQTFHSYIINNNTNAPLTSGAALLLNKEGQPLAQAKLYYTPVKGSTEIKLSNAVDVQVANDEDVKGRSKVTYDDNTYTKTAIAGKITVTNFKDKKIKIRVTKTLDGHFEVADSGGKERIEGSSQIYWEVEVEAGAKRVLGYRYYRLD